jgi:26S proteasome regulatory subunit N2
MATMMPISGVVGPARVPSADVVATASGWIALLQEPDATLKSFALKKLLQCVDTLWHEVAEALQDLEAISEELDLPLPMRQTAAAVASRVVFHLEDPARALRLALEAGEEHFDLQTKTPYVESLTTAALDAYVSERRKRLSLLDEDPMAGSGTGGSGKTTTTGTTTSSSTDLGISMEQLQGMVYRLLDACCEEGRYDHALGIALEAQETDKLRGILMSSGPDAGLLKYALESSITVVSSKAFRQESLAVIAECLSTQVETRKVSSVDLVIVYQLLGKADSVAEVLCGLLKASEEDALLGYQLCFDLVDSGDQAFVTKVADVLLPMAPSADNEHKDRWAQVARALTGGFSSDLALSFLHKQSHADRLIMENLKKSLEERGSGGRSSLLHNAAVMTHAYLYAGTTNDSFLRDYLDWMKKASNWYVPLQRLSVCVGVRMFVRAKRYHRMFVRLSPSTTSRYQSYDDDFHLHTIIITGQNFQPLHHWVLSMQGTLQRQCIYFSPIYHPIQLVTVRGGRPPAQSHRVVGMPRVDHCMRWGSSMGPILVHRPKNGRKQRTSYEHIFVRLTRTR